MDLFFNLVPWLLILGLYAAVFVAFLFLVYWLACKLIDRWKTPRY